MIIGIDASRANRKFKSGTEWYSYNLIRELAKIDSKNQYILYSDQPLTDDLAALAKTQKNFKARILNWPLSNFWTQGRLSWEMLRRPPDVLFVPAHTLPAIHPKKSIVTIHDIGFERQAELYSNDQIGPAAGWQAKVINFLAGVFTGGKFHSNILDYHSWSTKFALRRSAAIIAVSDFTKSEIKKIYGLSGDKIRVIHNGFNAHVHKKISDIEKIDSVLDQYDIKRPYIFYVGRLERKKNTARLVEAFSLMKHEHPELKYKLVLAGNAGLGFDEVKYVIEEFDLNNDVIITGWAPEPDMPYFFSGASLFVFPSLYEGFGIPLLEAMAAGVPLVCSDAASLPEVAGDAALYFNPRNKNDMAKKMAEVLMDKCLAEKLIKRGYGRVKDFALEKCARETLELMEKL